MPGALLRTMAAAFAMTIAGCSLMGLDHFALPICDANAQCEILNARAGIAASACMRWQCDATSSTCVLGARDGDRDGDPDPSCGGHDCDDGDGARSTLAAERCGPIDDDCDLLVDEGLTPPEAASLVMGVTGEQSASFADRADGTLGLAYSQSSGEPAHASFGLVSGASVVDAPSALVYAGQQSESSLSDGTLTAGQCPPSAGSCSAADIAIASADAASSRWLVAAINRSGCSDGQVRIGYLDESQREIVLRGPHVRSTIANGVDIDAADTSCTGLSRGAGVPRGASRAAITSLGSHGAGALPQGLAAWIGRPPPPPFTTDLCWRASGPVEVIGVWIESGTAGGAQVAWVNATGTGVQQALGTTQDDAPPALVAAPDAMGYLVGYGDDHGDVAIHFVPSWGDPPPIDENAVLNDATYPDATRPTDPLHPSPALVVPHAGLGEATEVALAIGHTTGTVIDVGITWREGCASGAGEIWLARAQIDTTDPTHSHVGAATRLAVQGREPRIVYVGTPLVANGFVRAGASADGAHDSGWIALWIDTTTPPTLFAQRVLELDGAPLGDPWSVAVGVRAAGVYGHDGALDYAYLDTPASTWLGGALTCTP